MSDDNANLKEEQPGVFSAVFLAFGFGVFVVILIRNTFPFENEHMQFALWVGLSVLSFLLALGYLWWHEGQYSWMVRRLEALNSKNPSEEKVHGPQPPDPWPISEPR